MHEDIGSPFTLADETEAADTIEPFDGNGLKRARGRHLRMSACRRQLRRMRQPRRLDFQHPQRLQAALAAHSLEHDARALDRDRKTVTPQASYVQEHIGQVLVRLDKAIA